MNNNSVETLNFSEIPMSMFVKIIEMAMKSRLDAVDPETGKIDKEKLKTAWGRPIFGMGKPGIGKTEILRGTIKRHLKKERNIEIGVVEVRLGSMQDSDITGLPTFYTDPESGKTFTQFADLKMLPHLEGEGGDAPEFGILVLDEITTCSEQVRTVALQLLDSSRSIGEYHLPDGWMIVALGNGPDDGADYAGLPETVLSRMAGYYVHPDIEAWYEWASQNGIHDVVLGFLKQNKQYLFDASAESEGGYGVQITNPRTWEATSDALWIAERFCPNNIIPEELILPICSSGVGNFMGSKLATFYSYRAYVIPMEEILSGQAMKRKSKDIRIESLYLAQQAIIREYLAIGDEYKKTMQSSTGKKGMSTQIFSLNSVALSSKPGAGIDMTKDDVMPEAAVKKLINLTDFLMKVAGAPDIPAGLDFSISTIESITKSCTYNDNPITKYMAMPQTKFGVECKKFSEFIKQHNKLLVALHGPGNDAFV